MSPEQHETSVGNTSATSSSDRLFPKDAVERRAQGRHFVQTDPNAQAFALILPGMRWLIGLLIATAIIAALYFGRDILIPLALAILLSFLLDPAVTRLKRWGLPRMAATLTVVVLVLGLLIGMGFYLGKQVQSLSADLPTYQNTIKKKLRSLSALIRGPSMWDGAFKTLDAVEGEISKASGESTSGAARVQKVEVVREAPKPMEKALIWLEKISAPIAMLGIVLLFVILILLDRDGLRDRLLRLMGGNLHVATDALDEAASRIGKYLRMQFIVNVTYGIPMAVGLWLIGVPGAFLWGVLATIMRFVPYVGPLISAIFPLALAFAVAPGWDMLLWTLSLILLLELVSNNVVEPWLYGASTGLSTLAIITAATFWTALWGPIGLILSTPLTVCCLVLGRYLPGLQFMEILLGSAPVLDAPHRLYQRLLANDVSGAIELAEEDIVARASGKTGAQSKSHAVIDFYAEVALPALLLANKHHNENATAEHRARLANGMEDLLEELQDEHPAAGVPGHVRAGAGILARVHCVGLRWEMDALAADMAAHSLQLDGVNASSASDTLTGAFGRVESEGWDEAQWLLLSCFHAQPQTMVRQLMRRIRRRHPHVQVVLALWNAAPSALSEEALQRMGAVTVVTSLQEMRLRMQQLISPEQSSQGYVPAQVPAHDPLRVQYLRESGVLSAEHLPTYKEAVLKAANAFNVKYAQVSLVDQDWVHTPGSLLVHAHKSGESPGLARDISICSYVVRDSEDLVVEDVARDPRFATNPELNEAGVKFYAGVPLKGKKGQVLGTLCIMHDAPRTMSEDEMQVLRNMAKELIDTVREEGKQPPSSGTGS